MRGAWLQRGAVGLVLLFGGPSLCFAETKYDRNLEDAVKEIVARKMKANFRGPLGVNWKLPERIAVDTPVIHEPEPSPTFVETEIRLPSDSMLGFRRPAITTSAIQALGSFIEPPPPDRPVRIVYF